MSSPFMGSVMQCVTHLVERYSTQLPRPIMAEFCGVVEPTALSWMKGDNLPVGTQLIKLRVFMQLAGYRVDELDVLNRQTRQLGEIIAVDLMTPEEVRDALDYKNVQDVYRLVREGSTGPMRSRQLKLERLLEGNAEEREKKLAVWQGRIRGLLEEAEVDHKRQQPTVTSGSPSQVAEPGSGVDAPGAIASLLRTREHLGNALIALYSTMSEAQHGVLRDQIGDNAYHDLVREFSGGSRI